MGIRWPSYRYKMLTDTFVFLIFIIFSGAALLSTITLYLRLPLLLAYIILGMVMGPWGLKFVSDSTVIHQSGDIGIIFLLFLLGLHLQPQNLWHMLRKVTGVAIVSSVVLAAVGYAVGIWFGFGQIESLIIGSAIMFSSTIIGLKLLPTTIMHHQHIGEVMISVLLFQDLLAIIVLLILRGAGDGFTRIDVAFIVIALPGMLLFAFLVQKFILIKLIARFDQTQEYIFLLSLGWCLSIAVLAKYLGLSQEIGAFIGGVALAANPISLFIAESLKPLRDFFLVLFFFSIGASFNFHFLSIILWPALILAGLLLLIKPLLYRYLLLWVGEKRSVAWEVGVRLGQTSEFSLLVAYLASRATPPLIGDSASYLIQATTIITFIVSSYFVVLRYPTPIAISDKMRRD